MAEGGDVQTLNINVSYTISKADIFNIKTLANVSFYTTAGAEVINLMT